MNAIQRIVRIIDLHPVIENSECMGGRFGLRNQLTKLIPALWVAGRDFELDSKIDFLYSEFFRQSELNGQFNGNPVLRGNTIS